MTREQFIAQLAPQAIQARREGSPLLPSVRLAQNILETGGNSIPATYNLGGYKVGSGKPNAYWRGAVVRQGTWEVYNGQNVQITAAFRAYDSVYAFYKDQDLLLQNVRYAQVGSGRTPKEQAQALQDAGYATDPAYASKLVRLIVQYSLEQYDTMAEKGEEQMAKDQEQDGRLTLLEDAVKRLEAAAGRLEKLQAMEAPSWAKEAAKGLAAYYDTPVGSYDFWRMLTIMYRQQHAQEDKR